MEHHNRSKCLSAYHDEDLALTCLASLEGAFNTFCRAWLTMLRATRFRLSFNFVSWQDLSHLGIDSPAFSSPLLGLRGVIYTQA